MPLKQEMDFLQGYLEIERTRFHDRLTIRVDIEPAAWDAQVPTSLLQPLVENAIRHGISPHARPGRVEICAARAGDDLLLDVRDNGGGLAENGHGTAGGGVGIAQHTRPARAALWRGASLRASATRRKAARAVTRGAAVPHRVTIDARPCKRPDRRR